MDKRAPFSFTYFGKKRRILLGALLLTLLQIALFAVYRDRGGLLVDTLTDVRLFFGKLIFDRLLVDCFSIAILFFLTLRFKNLIAPNYPSSLREIIMVNLRYLPILLLSLLLFIPLAILLRHFIRNGFAFEAERLARNFRNFGKMYMEYSIPFSLVGYLLFNNNLFLQRPNEVATSETDSGNETANGNRADDLLEVINDNGNIMIQLTDVFWIEKKNRTYAVKTLDNTYSIRKTIKELEELLGPKGFLRINRGVIVNKNYLHNYSYWEYDKFILRMQDADHTEFIVSRDRMKQIKHQLTKTS